MNTDDGRFDIDRMERLPAVEELVERQRERLVEGIAEQTEHYLREVIAETDWDEVTVVDVVERGLDEKYATVSEEEILSQGYERSFKVYRYTNRSAAPSEKGHYTRGVGHDTKLYRVTEQALHEIDVDPETGVDTYGSFSP